jgi:hypothetical protein
VLIVEKVCYRVLNLLKRYKSVMIDNLMTDAVFSNHMTRLQTVTDHRTSILAALGTAGRDLEIPVWAIKGLCARKW